jgi:hypothetical protein
MIPTVQFDARDSRRHTPEEKANDQPLFPQLPAKEKLAGMKHCALGFAAVEGAACALLRELRELPALGTRDMIAFHPPLEGPGEGG